LPAGSSVQPHGFLAGSQQAAAIGQGNHALLTATPARRRMQVSNRAGDGFRERALRHDPSPETRFREQDEGSSCLPWTAAGGAASPRYAMILRSSRGARQHHYRRRRRERMSPRRRAQEHRSDRRAALRNPGQPRCSRSSALDL
jgi:hypothetical protein